MLSSTYQLATFATPFKMATAPVPSSLPELAEAATRKTAEKKENAQELCRDMFEKVADYVNGELKSIV